MRRAPVVWSGLLGVLAFAPAGMGPGIAMAQISELWAEVGASRILPPDGVSGGGADFVVAGLRATRFDLLGSGVFGSFLVGKSMDGATGGDFVSGELGGTGRWLLGGGWSTELDARASGFHVAEPFSYQAAAAEGSLGLRYRAGPISASFAGTGGVGRSRVVLSTVVQRMRHEALVRQEIIDDLWRYGGTLEVLAGGTRVAAGLAAGIHESAGGTFRSVGARVLAGGGRGVLQIRLDAWDTPEGVEKTGGITFYVPWGGWSARGTAGKPEPDPLLLAEPGRGAGGMLVGRRILGSGWSHAHVPLYEVTDRTSTGAHVRFAVQAPEGAGSVELLGDFTLWDPVPMRSRGGSWTAEVDVPDGTYHFGFLVDGAWYLPADAADAVPDEWGRKSATVVIEGEVGS